MESADTKNISDCQHWGGNWISSWQKSEKEEEIQQKDWKGFDAGNNFVECAEKCAPCCNRSASPKNKKIVLL